MLRRRRGLQYQFERRQASVVGLCWQRLQDGAGIERDIGRSIRRSASWPVLLMEFWAVQAAWQVVIFGARRRHRRLWHANMEWLKRFLACVLGAGARRPRMHRNTGGCYVK